MASSATPHGFRPVNLLGGRSHSGAFRQIPIASGYNTNIFFGDVVKLVAAGTVEKDTGTDAMTPVGIFLGCTYTDATLGHISRMYWPANTVSSDAKAHVCDDPDAVFQIQGDDSVALADVGANAAIVQTAGSTTTGMSKVTLDASSVATTNTLPVRIVGLVDGPDSASADAYTDVLVKWNAGHQYGNTTGL